MFEKAKIKMDLFYFENQSIKSWLLAEKPLEIYGFIYAWSVVYLSSNAESAIKTDEKGLIAGF